MTIASEITRLQDVRTDIYDELGNKCVNLDGSSKYADVAPIIKKMPVVCAKIGANKYPVVKIGNQLWTAKNLDEDLGTIGTNEWYYNGRTEKTNFFSFYKKVLESKYFSGFLYNWNNGTSSGNTPFQPPSRNINEHLVVVNNSSIVVNVRIRIVGRNSSNSVITQYFGSATDVGVGESVSFDRNISLTENFVSIERFDVVFNQPIDNVLVNETRLCFGTTDCGANAIDVPTALANEATYKKYGRLYTWDNVNTNLASLGLQGWRWPNQEDYQSLASIDSTGKKLRSKSFFNGTDDYGFFAIPSGRKAVAGFDGVNTYLECWGKKDSSVVRFKITSVSCVFDNLGGKSEGRSIRLVCDLNEDGSIPDGAVIIAEADESAVATLADDGVAVASVEPSTDSES